MSQTMIETVIGTDRNALDTTFAANQCLRPHCHLPCSFDKEVIEGRLEPCSVCAEMSPFRKRTIQQQKARIAELEEHVTGLEEDRESLLEMVMQLLRDQEGR